MLTVCEEEVERQYEMQGIATRPSHAPNSDTSSALPVSNAQDTNPKGQSVSQAEGATSVFPHRSITVYPSVGRKRNEDHETNAHQFQINDAIEYMPIQAGKVQAEAEVHSLKPSVYSLCDCRGFSHLTGTQISSSR